MLDGTALKGGVVTGIQLKLDWIRDKLGTNGHEVIQWPFNHLNSNQVKVHYLNVCYWDPHCCFVKFKISFKFQIALDAPCPTWTKFEGTLLGVGRWAPEAGFLGAGALLNAPHTVLSLDNTLLIPGYRPDLQDWGSRRHLQPEEPLLLLPQR